MKEWLDTPITYVAGALASLGLAIQPVAIEALVQTLWGQAGTIFTALSISAFTVTPNVEFLAPYTSVFQGAALITAGLFLAKLGWKTYDAYENKL